MGIKIFLILALLFNSAIALCTESFQIKTILLEGRSTSPDTFLLTVPIHIGDKVTADKDLNKMHSLFSQGIFDNLSYFRKCHPIVFLIKNQILHEHLQAKGIQSSDLLNYFTLNAVKRSIRDFSVSFDRYQSGIHAKIEQSLNNSVIFKSLYEYTQKIKQINITGNDAYSSADLFRKLRIKNQTHWWHKITALKYENDLLKKDLSTLQIFYINHGYLRFKINHPKITLTPDEKDIYININISEGDKYTISKVYIDNPFVKSSNLSNELQLDTNFLVKQMNVLSKIHIGETYRQFKILEIHKKIKSILGTHGYIYSNLLSEIYIDDKNKTVELYVHIKPGKQYYVNKIEFIGNSFTRDSTLRKEIRQLENTVLHTDVIAQDRSRLENTGFFRVVKIETKPPLSGSNKVDIIFHVKEGKTGKVNIKGDVPKSSNVFNVIINLLDKNFMGTGKTFSLKTNTSVENTNVSLLWNNPHLTKSGLSLKHSWFYNYNQLFTKYSPAFINHNQGANVNLGIPIAEHTTFTVGASHFYNKLYNIPDDMTLLRYINSLKKKPIKKTLSISDFKFNNSITYNTLNTPVYPKRGSYVQLDNTITLPGSDDSYFKTQLDVKHYFTLSKRHQITLLARGTIGYLTGLNNQEGPVYEHYYIGGMDTIRGFTSNSIGPNIIYQIAPHSPDQEKSLFVSHEPAGGNFLANVSLEATSSIPFVPKQYQYFSRLSTFMDAGNVWDSHWKNSPQTLQYKVPNYADYKRFRLSVGMQLQWISPIGLLSFSLAKPLRFFAGDTSENFQVNIGNNW